MSKIEWINGQLVRTWEFGEVCIHDRLGRSCDICELNDECDQLTRDRDTARRWARVWKRKAKFYKRAYVNGVEASFHKSSADIYMIERDKLRAELAELRGRTCAGCKHFTSEIVYVETGDDAVPEEDGTGRCCLVDDFRFDEDHYCKAWKKK